jgi:cell division protein FtsB
VPEAKRPDPKRRSPTSRPGKPAKAAETGRGRPRSASPARREPRAAEPKPTPKPTPEAQPSEPEGTADSIRKSIAESAEQQSEQRFGSAARRAAILAAVVCVLTLTIAGPVRTYFGQRTEMKQLKATEEQLRAQIAQLEQQKGKLGDPVFIAAQARERLGFVMPGEIPYQVQLPANSALPGTPGAAPVTADPDQPWYTALWKTISDAPHGVPLAPAPGLSEPGVPPAPPPAAPNSVPAPGG